MYTTGVKYSVIICETTSPPQTARPRRTARFAARSVTKRHRYRSEQRRPGRHHDRSEPDQAAFVDRLRRVLVSFALRFEREIDLHDRVLLHQPDQHDKTHERVNVQFDSKNDQCQERADAG